MELILKVRNIAASICLVTLSGMVYADDTVVNLELPTAASFYTRSIQTLNSQSFNTPTYLLAANDGDDVLGQANVTPHPATEFKPPWMSGRKAHQYLGLGTVVLAGLTMIAAPGEGCEGCSPASQPPRQTSGTTHTRLARATAVMAAATVITGLVYHWNDIHWEDPFTDPDKMHARLATAGALMMLYAVHKSATSTVPTSHSGIAELGAVAMVVAIKLTW
jgi:hypothetical protein